MKKLLSLLFLSLLTSIAIKSYAFNYNITFTGSNASTSVASVEVQNLTKGTTVIVPTGNTLNLYDVVSSIDQPSIFDDAIHIYPNPMQGKATVSFFVKQAGNTQINVFGVDGRNLTAINSNLQEGNNTFQLSLAPGAYILKVNGNGYSYAQRVISQSNSTAKPTITLIGNEKPTNSQPQKLKNGGTVTSMFYENGDQLLYKGISGNYTTIVTDKPNGSKTTNFNFVECKDADDNYYPVVIIGSQIWMAENLKTTSYRTGEGVSNVTINASWMATNFGAWCVYDNLTNNGTQFGKLYNWYAAIDARNVAPTSWHVPTDAEWVLLATYLGGESIAGGKLKQNGIVNWISPNTNATNETGFSAIAGGIRSYYSGPVLGYGAFSSLMVSGYWWSTTQTNTTSAWARTISNNGGSINGYGVYNKMDGYSIRCISDIVIVIPPTLSTTAATLITGNSVTAGGNVTLQGGAAVTARGVCWSTSSSPTIALSTKTSDGNGTGIFTSAITGLTPNTTYYVRAFATNNGGTSYGTEVSFQTATTPSLTTTLASNIASTTATSGGNISSDGRATVTARGVCWSTNPSPTIYDSRTSDATGTGSFTSALTVLFSSTTYYVRAYATNSVGTAYGNEQTLTTTKAQDIDGNLYSSVKIGTQTWMGENLKTTKYRTGESISKPTTATNWSNATYGAWCDYNSDAANGTKYGHLYNWYAVSDNRNIALLGWHVATDAEWTTLTTYLDENVAGSKLKETGTLNWAAPNTDATNQSGFMAIPCGTRYSNGTFDGVGNYGYWWSSSENYTNNAWGRYMYSNISYVDRSYSGKAAGLSVRCVRDELATLTTIAATAITAYNATAGGNITSDGGAAITARGVCWSTSSNPTVFNSKTSVGTGAGVFGNSLTGLSRLTTYYARAYATNAVGTSYGNEMIFTTLDYAISTALIPAGTFAMGSPLSEVNRSLEETQYQVTLSAFCMSKYEITNAQYAAFLNAKSIGSNGLYAAGVYPEETLIKANTSGGLTYNGSQWVLVVGYETFPVINVTWYGSAEFATYVGGTLPTEAQWEYACRGGTTTPFCTGSCLNNTDANYDWRNPYNNCVNTITTPLNKTQPVGSYAPNDYGLYDMHGNVWEWCADWYGTYPTSSQNNPTGATTGFGRVVRGGSMNYKAFFCRSAYRNSDYPGIRNFDYVGFRVVFLP